MDGYPMISYGEMQQLTGYAQNLTKKTMVENTVSKLACVVEGDGGGGWNCRTSDGRDMLSCIAVDTTIWNPGQWVTLEKTNDGWLITGVGAFDGGPIPDAA